MGDDLALYIQHQTQLIEMETQSRRLQLEVKAQEETLYYKNESNEEYWNTYKDLKIKKAKLDLELHKLYMCNYIKNWEADHPQILEKPVEKPVEKVIEKVITEPKILSESALLDFVLMVFTK